MIKKVLSSVTQTIIKSSILLLLVINTSLAKAQCCNYTLSMHDSYGDGWNGGQLNVYINGTLQGTYSAANTGSSAFFQVCDGDSLKLNYTAGNYENENSYQLYDAGWNLLFSNGPTPSTGMVFAAVGNCFSISVLGSNPCNAIQIDTGQCIIADNTGLVGSGLNAGCASYTGGDVWFRMTVPVSGGLIIATDSGSINDTGLAIWTDTSCTALHSIACDDDSGVGYFSNVGLYNLTPGQTLYIQVWGYGTAVGTFRLCVSTAPIISVDSTILPLVMINTLGNQVVQGPKVNAFMEIKYYGPTNYTHFNDTANVYKGNIGIDIHGASSAGYPQRPYGIETRTITGASNDVSLLDMPAENDWLLISNYNDLTLVRNTFAQRLFNQMGNYGPRTKLCEVFIDSAYQGIYVFCEKIKRDNGRVNIARLTTLNNTGNALTGGYILQQNLWNNSNSFQSNYSPIDHPGFDVHYLYEYPKPDSITAPQKTYIASYVDSLETALYSANFADTSIGYRKYLDVKSFIDYFIVNEVSRNADGFKKSVFFNKDKFSNGGKLKAGPVWDFDWAWKDLNGCSIYSNSNGSGWAHHNNDCNTDNYSNGYYIRLLQDTTFNNQLRCTYDYYRQTILSDATINGYLDSMRNMVQQAEARHFQKWQILGTSGPAPEVNAVATTYNASIDTLKSWISRRIQWLDANIPGHCAPIHLGINQSSITTQLNYFPNPSTGTFHFEGTPNSATPLKMKVYDMKGEEVDNKILPSGYLKFDYQLERRGVYYFTISNSSGTVQYGKLIVI